MHNAEFRKKTSEFGFICREASVKILSKYGIGFGNVEKGGQFLGVIIANSRISCDQQKWYREFVSIFSLMATYASLGTIMTEDFKMNLPHSSSIPFTAQTNLPAIKPQSVHTHSQLQWCRVEQYIYTVKNWGVEEHPHFSWKQEGCCATPQGVE